MDAGRYLKRSSAMTRNKGLMPIKLDERLKRIVWEKGHPIPGENAGVVRRDDLGNRIYFHLHGDRSSSFGWEIDHIKPQAQGGTDDLHNLRPLYWLDNVRRAGRSGLRAIGNPPSVSPRATALGGLFSASRHKGLMSEGLRAVGNPPPVSPRAADLASLFSSSRHKGLMSGLAALSSLGLNWGKPPR